MLIFFHLNLTLTFFSGFLFTVNFCMKREKNLPLHSFTRHLLNRWCRFTPSIIGYITICLTLSLLGNGPLFHPNLIDHYTRPCLTNLWMQLLYINNWFDFKLSVSTFIRYSSIISNLSLYLKFVFFSTYLSADFKPGMSLLICSSICWHI